MPVKEEIAEDFLRNVARANSLIETYEALFEHRHGPVEHADILRAAVVLLHAGLEDLLRSLLEWKLPAASSEILDRLLWPGFPKRARREKQTIGYLAGYRGSTVDELITESVIQFLEDSSFNDAAQVQRACADIGLDVSLLRPYLADIETMIKRRHWIVHRADKDALQGEGPVSAP